MIFFIWSTVIFLFEGNMIFFLSGIKWFFIWWKSEFFHTWMKNDFFCLFLLKVIIRSEHTEFEIDSPFSVLLTVMTPHIYHDIANENITPRRQQYGNYMYPRFLYVKMLISFSCNFHSTWFFIVFFFYFFSVFIVIFIYVVVFFIDWLY